MSEMDEGQTYWNYRRFKIQLDDGCVYGMKEAYFICHEGKALLEYWDAEPMYTAQNADDLTLRIDQYEAAFKKTGEIPEWGEGYSEVEFLAALKHQRRACSEKVIDEIKIMEGWG